MIQKFYFAVTGITIPGLDPGDVPANPDGVDDDLGTAGERVVNLMLWIIGATAVIMIVAGAIMMITADGNPEKFKKGKQAVIGACIGLAAAILVGFILRLALGAADGTIRP